jgi:polysaccharide export outer membrane protein
MHKRLLSASLVLITFAGAGVAQQESLLIGAGDQLHIQVFDTPEMEQHPRVTDAGTVPLLFVGDVKLAGMTPGDAAHAIEDVLKQKQYMLHPHVAVTVEEYATQQVAVLGQVKTAGTYDITAPTPIINILSKAGGLTDLADRHITIERRGDANQKFSYFLSNSSEKALTDNVLVYPGDTVLVPRVGVVYVLGDVGRPGGFPMSSNDSDVTLLQALALAGAANKTALLSKAKLIRKTPNGPTDVPIELASVQKGKARDIALQPDDVLFVPSSWMKSLAANSSMIAAQATSAVIYAHP